LDLLRSLPEPGKRAVVMVTHDGQAAVYGDRIVHIRDGLIDAEQTVVHQEDTGIRMAVPRAQAIQSVVQVGNPSTVP
jgi:ABC-type lipoprotein export system ATPase subunit